MSSSRKVMYNLGAAKFCANCLGKMASLMIDEKRGVHCSCSHCQNNNFSRCSSCLIVPYCSKQCQVEHWRYHKKICKKLSGKVMEIPPPGMELDYFKVNMFRFTVQMFCHSFQTNGFSYNSRLQPPALPFPYRWNDRQLNGWIEEYLIHLASMAVRLLGTGMKTFISSKIGNYVEAMLSTVTTVFILRTTESDRNNYDLEYLAQNFATLRGFYLFLVSTEKDRKMSELKFAMMVLSCVSIYFQRKIENYEVKARRARRDKRELWDSLVFSLSNFYWRLRMVKYQFINTQSLLKKPGKYQNLRHFVEAGLDLLKSDGREELHRVRLPPHTNCVGCEENLGERVAKLCIKLPNKVIWPREDNMASVLQASSGETGTGLCFKLPPNITCPSKASALTSLLQMKTKSIVTCGRHSCNKDAEGVYSLSLLLEGSGLFKFLRDSKICHGCSKYSLNTHRCSRCRLTRWCSQDCFNINWRDHRVKCEPYSRPGNQELFATKKLVGQAKKDYLWECSNMVSRYYDPFIGSAFSE